MSESVITAKNFSRVHSPVLFFLILVDRMPSQILTTMSVRSLREYIEAYGIAKEMPFVEKSDLINAILSANITEHNEEVTLPTRGLLTGGYSGRLHLVLETGTNALRATVLRLVFAHLLAPLHNLPPPLPTRLPIQPQMDPLQTSPHLDPHDRLNPLNRLFPRDLRRPEILDRLSSIQLKQGLRQMRIFTLRPKR